MSKTVSVSKGSGSLGHNNRTFITENVNSDRTHLNITFVKESLSESYEKLFSESVNNYNDKQKRADRKIDNYMDKIRNSKNGEELFHEIIVQVGNKHTCHTESKDGDKAAEILQEYMMSFQARNPHLFVFNAVLHLDEETPHLHIDYIPWADGYKTGMQVRNALDRALRQQGHEVVIDKETGKKDFQNATHKWEESEKQALAEVMERHGWDRAEDSGLHRERLTLKQYKAVVGKVETMVEQLPEQIATTKVPFSDDKVIVNKSDLEKLEQRAKLSIVHEEATEGIEQKMAERSEEHQDFMQQQREKIEGELVKAKEKNHEAEVYRAENAIALFDSKKNRDDYKKLYNEQVALNDTCNNLKMEIQDLKGEIRHREGIILELGEVNQNLTAENTSLKAKNGDLKAEIVRIKEVATNQIKTLQKSLCGEIRDICKAVSLLAFAQTEFKANLTKKQARLVEAIGNHGANVVEAQGLTEEAHAIRTKAGVSDRIDGELKKLEKSRAKESGLDR